MAATFYHMRRSFLPGRPARPECVPAVSLLPGYGRDNRRFYSRQVLPVAAKKYPAFAVRFGLFGTILFYTIPTTCTDPRRDVQELMRISSKLFFRTFTRAAGPPNRLSPPTPFPGCDHAALHLDAPQGDQTFVMERAACKTGFAYLAGITRIEGSDQAGLVKLLDIYFMNANFPFTQLTRATVILETGMAHVR